MNKRSKKDIAVFIILFAILIGISIYYTNKSKGMGGIYSVFNRKSNGYSVIYEGLSQMGYDVKLENEEIEDLSLDNICIISSPRKEFSIEDKSVKDWIQKGGMLVYLEKKNVPMLFDEKIDASIEVNVENEGNGKILISKSDYFTNKYLFKNKKDAYEIIKIIDKWPHDKIVFNEYYNYKNVSNYSLWEDTPEGIRIIFQQFVIVIILFFIYKGSRFGKIKDLYEETQRKEHEQLHAVASLYKRSDLKSHVIDIYYGNLKNKIKKIYKLKGAKIDLEQIYREKKFNDLELAIKVENDYKKIINSNITNREFIHTIKSIEKLSTNLEKRSGDNWKEIRKK